MVKPGEVEIKGVVTEGLPNATFRVKLDDGRLVLATISGKMRIHRIRILEGDEVTVLLTPYDLTRGRIVYRHRVPHPGSVAEVVTAPVLEDAAVESEEIAEIE